MLLYSPFLLMLLFFIVQLMRLIRNLSLVQLTPYLRTRSPAFRALLRSIRRKKILALAVLLIVTIYNSNVTRVLHSRKTPHVRSPIAANIATELLFDLFHVQLSRQTPFSVRPRPRELRRPPSRFAYCRYCCRLLCHSAVRSLDSYAHIPANT